MKSEKTFTYTKQTLGIFWRHAMRYRWQAVTVICSVIALTGFQTYIPILYRDVLNVLAHGVSPETLARAIHIVIIIFLVTAIRTGLWRGSNFVNNSFASKVMRDLTNTCFEYLQRHSLGFFNSNFVGSLVTKVKRYERSFEQIADQFTFDLGRSLLDTAMILAVILWFYPTLGVAVFLWCVAFMIFSYFFAMFKLPYDITRAAMDTKTTGQLADSITNNINIKLFTNYEREEARFADVTGGQARMRKKSWDLGSWGDLVQGFSMIILEFWVMYHAVGYWANGTLQVGDIALLQTYLARIFDKLWNTGKYVRSIYEALADANEMTEMLLTPHEIQDVPGAVALRATKGGVAFRDVSFKYHRRAAVLTKFNLEIAPGERVAFVGPSGGGKSTIAKLLFRFHDIEGGEIQIDGQNIAHVTQDSLRAALAFVPQDPILFHRSLMENIRYARPQATDAEVIRAAKLAHAHEFISSFPDRYDTLVGERGLKLSGGERQRVAIARAILKDAAILVLDEATSSLDSESELYIQDALKKLMERRTTLVIAHRLSTIMQMDRIIVIDHGAVIEEGKHKELLKAKKGMYQKLWGIQAGSFAAVHR